MKANQAREALIQYEAGQDKVDMKEMSQVDRATFQVSDAPWSNAPGKEPNVKPDGLATGGNITPSDTTDSVDVEAATCYQEGVKVSVSSATLDLGRDGTGDDYQIQSVVIDDTGSYTLVAGSAGTAFTETRGDAGGPPLIPTGQIEVGQVRVDSASSADIVEDEIYQVVNIHQERYDFPLWTEYPAKVVDGSLVAQIEFISDLPQIHSADSNGFQTKNVWCQVYTPIFANLEPAAEYTPPETSHSQDSTEVYGGAIGSLSTSLNQGSFTVYMQDGVTDHILGVKDTEVWVKFYPHRKRAPYLLAQGALGMSRSFPAGDSIQAECTLSASEAAVEVAS